MDLFSITLSLMGLILIVLAVTFLIIILKLSKKIFSKLILIMLNSVAGLIFLLALNVLFNAGIPINLFTIIITGLFGMAGIGSLILLKLGGII